MNNDYVPLGIASVADGKVQQRLDQTITEVAQELHDFCLKEGYDNTKKVSAEITLKVKIVHVESGLMVSRASIGHKLPTAPDSAGRLVVVNGKVLACRPEITERDDVHQKVMEFTQGDNPRKKEM